MPRDSGGDGGGQYCIYHQNIFTNPNRCTFRKVTTAFPFSGIPRVILLQCDNFYFLLQRKQRGERLNKYFFFLKSAWQDPAPVKRLDDNFVRQDTILFQKCRLSNILSLSVSLLPDSMLLFWRGRGSSFISFHFYLFVYLFIYCIYCFFHVHC